MNDLIQSLGDALNRDLDALNSVAQNLANVNTPGYKSVNSIDNQNKFMDKLNATSGLQLQTNTNLVVNMSAGSLKQTKRNLDFALSGNAFFVLGSEGGDMYSRNGAFKVSEDGVLVNSTGLPVLTQSGELYVENSNALKIAKDGTVMEANNIIGQLDIVSVLDYSNVSIAGNGMLETSTTNIKREADWIVHQGFLETSNVDSSQEMIKMMQISKHFESVQRALSIYDQAMTSGVNKIGQ